MQCLVYHLTFVGPVDHVLMDTRRCLHPCHRCCRCLVSSLRHIGHCWPTIDSNGSGVVVVVDVIVVVVLVVIVWLLQ